MLRPLSVAVSVALAACGGSDADAAAAPPPTPPAAPAAPPDARLAGRWAGGIAVTGPSLSVTYTTTLSVAVEGDAATVSGLCPDGSGSITARASGDSAEWRGRVECPPMDVPVCAVVLTYLGASLRLHADGTLAATGTGTADACGAFPSVTFSFRGAR